MKKVLLAGTALMGVVALSAPAQAEVKLGLGGYFSGYGVWSDNHRSNLRELDLRRDSEVHISGETTLDSGLTVGFHSEQALGNLEYAIEQQEVYLYFSNNLGRINFGKEDSAPYLLQVAAPAADSNIDGLRTYIQALSPATNQTVFYKYSDDDAGRDAVAINFSSLLDLFDSRLDYDQDLLVGTRLTYLSPKVGGFQAGLTFKPYDDILGAVDAPDQSNHVAAVVGAGAATTTVTGDTQFKNVWEAALRWDGDFQGLGVSLGGGFGTSALEARPSLAAVVGDRGKFGVTDGFETWNLGASLVWEQFSFGASYLNKSIDVEGVTDSNGGTYTVHSGEVERHTWTVGLGWDQGPWHLGTSYYKQRTETPTFGASTNNAADIFFTGNENEVDRLTFGTGYTFGPGMSVRGSVAFGEFDAGGAVITNGTAVEATDNNFTQVAVGTHIDF